MDRSNWKCFMQNGYDYKCFELIGYPITVTIHDDGDVHVYYRNEHLIGKVGFSGRYLRNMDTLDNKYYDEIFSELILSIKFISILNDFISITMIDIDLCKNLIGELSGQKYNM